MNKKLDMAFGSHIKKMQNGKSMMDNWIAHERQLGFENRFRAVRPQVLSKV